MQIIAPVRPPMQGEGLHEALVSTLTGKRASSKGSYALEWDHVSCVFKDLSGKKVQALTGELQLWVLRLSAALGFFGMCFLWSSGCLVLHC